MDDEACIARETVMKARCWMLIAVVATALSGHAADGADPISGLRWTLVAAPGSPVQILKVEPAGVVDATQEHPTLEAYTVTVKNSSRYDVESVVAVGKIFRGVSTTTGLFAGGGRAEMSPGDMARIRVTCRQGLIAPDSTVILVVGEVRYAATEDGQRVWTVPRDRISELDARGEGLPAGVTTTIAAR